ncbi:Uncharacterised protein [Vibrio cholerae]|nr:Uncharacterised protein [Vibrio cholerae]CSA53458.1 Uncharacterised protein [Vibrio cholerae]CSI74557.1 Uncharacterised protein [Vibrio cholerae]
MQLGGHAARTECSATATSNFAQCVINGGHFFDQLGIGIFTRIGGEQAFLIGQQQQLIRTTQNTDQRR